MSIVFKLEGENGVLRAILMPKTEKPYRDREFLNGNHWSKDAKSVAAPSDSVSNAGRTPVGPFGPGIVRYRTLADINDPDLSTYNAKAHLALSDPGELLISYNVNFLRPSKQPNLYGQRFMRIKFNHTKNN